ncbi:hypothetical protein SGPA1_20159 [Streptomyces misionensis JCM 4497]
MPRCRACSTTSSPVPHGGRGGAVDAGRPFRRARTPRVLSAARRVFEHGARGSDPFTAPHTGAADAPAGRRKVGESSEGTSEGGTG